MHGTLHTLHQSAINRAEEQTMLSRVHAMLTNVNVASIGSSSVFLPIGKYYHAPSARPRCGNKAMRWRTGQLTQDKWDASEMILFCSANQLARMISFSLGAALDRVTKTCALLKNDGSAQVNGVYGGAPTPGFALLQALVSQEMVSSGTFYAFLVGWLVSLWTHSLLVGWI